MKARLIPMALLSIVAASASNTMAAPVELTKAQMDQVVAGAITPVKENRGGNTPNGNANGVPTVNKNPAGKAPPGRN